jgi:hypothetical protein
LVIGGYFALREYNRAPAAADRQKVEHTVTAEQLMAEFREDEAAARQKYVGDTDQVIQVSGTIREIERSGEEHVIITLETGDPFAGVMCSMNNKDLPEHWKEGDHVELIGFCQGIQGVDPLIDIIIQRSQPVN